MNQFVLIIEDSPTIRTILERMMRREGYLAMSFPNGLAAMQWLASIEGRVPALILLDIEMPKMDGIAVLRYLKKRPALAEIPVIVITGREGTIDQLKARLAGACEYIIKPFTTRQIIEVARRYLLAEPAGAAQETREIHQRRGRTA